MKRESPAKKHHFWILLGLVPLFTLIAVLVVSSSVGGEIERRQGEIKAANEDISKKKDPKPEKLLLEQDKVAGVVDKKQGTLHKDNWEMQKALFTWPGSTRPGTSNVFAAVEEKGLKFGAPVGDLSALFSEFQRVETYQHEYSSLRPGAAGPGTGMADRLAPTQFKNGWQSVLRHVTNDGFGQVTVNKEQVWLILEDMWVQRSLLDGIRTVNEEMAKFERVRLEKAGVPIDDPSGKPTAQNKNHRLFRSRVWELELELTPEGTSYRLGGTLTNISDRLQLMGNGNVMTLHVWLSPNPAAQPMVFKIGNEFLPGRGATKQIADKDGKTQVVQANVLPIVPMPDHTLPAGSVPTDLEIVRVEQVFDVRTVPVKRIDDLVLGKLDSRSQGQPLLAPLGVSEGGQFSDTFVKDAAPADGASGPGGTPPGGVPPVAAGGRPGPGPGAPGGTTGAGGASGGGSLVAVIDANKKRYLARTPQVRRMPVGMVVIVDQSYLQDVLLALSNSPLRFQITQVTWTRYRGTLDGAGIGGGTGITGSGGIDSAPTGVVNFGGLGGDPDGPRPGGPRPGPGGLRPGPGSGPGPVMPPGAVGPGSPGYPGSSSGSGQSVVSDSQITSGLVELSVYGIVSLYEKYEAPKPADAGASGTPSGTPQPGAPTTPPAAKPRRTVRRGVRARG